MAKKVFSGLINRRVFTYITAADFLAGNDFLVINYQSPLPMDIYGVNWGYVYGILADKALHIGGWMAIVENYLITTAQNPTGFSVINPEEGVFGDGIMRYVDFITDAVNPGDVERTFPAPLRIDAGRAFSVIVNKPSTSGVIGGTMVLNLNLFAAPVEMFNQDPNPYPWNLAGSRYRK